MARYERVKGLPVLTLAEGKRVGKIDELVVDPERKVVRWLRLHTGGLLQGERMWVDVGAVHGFGEDAVTINAEADVRAPADAPEADALVKSRRGIIGNKVVTECGERVGEVSDYEFAPDSFALTSLFVPPGMNLLGQFLTVAGDKVLTIGKTPSSSLTARRSSQKRQPAPPGKRYAPERTAANHANSKGD